MTTRFTAAEKGKALARNPPGPPRLRMRAPDFDPTDLIKENILTLVGRLTNTREQRMSAVLPYLARKWNLDSSSGSDLGNDCFQFRFNKEEDIRDTLHNRPYQYGRWMIRVQRWEPVISQNFPSQIPFWISLRGIPLHYWHEKVLDTYEVTKTTARVRVVVDGLKPLIMEAYENLGNHCTNCYRLSYLQSQCPEGITIVPSRTESINLLHYTSPSRSRNKITPSSFYQNNLRTAQTQMEHNLNNYSSPPYTRRQHNNQEDRHGYGILQWRAKSPLLEQEVTPPSAPFQPPRQSVDFPPVSALPSREEVMEEIREATLQYINCPDPMESAARKQRVLQSEMNGEVEEAATRILQASTSAAMARTEKMQLADTSNLAGQMDTTADTSVRRTRKCGCPPKPSERRTTVRVRPKTYSATKLSQNIDTTQNHAFSSTL
ncbi:hypothetical protein Bca52824_073514 [Brassica carinata]|uniref:DUF4283 domain-containing protein n=1 Tax=Brassica carinata TaxID=52824 RepID=A0A8X7QA73_BRACI|nr:hypothetical protein Bca52824_073514 [Brassica carinata]